MKISLSLLMLTLFFNAAHALAQGQCPKGAKLNDAFYSKYWVAIRFDQGLPLSGNQLTFLGTHSGFRRYMGSEVRIIVNHTDKLKEIEPGAVLFTPEYTSGLHANGHMPSRTSDMFTSNLDWFIFGPNPFGVNSISVHSQFGSDVTVRRLEKELNHATLLCKEINPAPAANAPTDNSTTLPSTEPQSEE